MANSVEEYKQLLTSLGIRFVEAGHPDLRTGAEVQKYLGLGMEDGLSTMIMKAGERFIAIIRRDDTRLDMGKLRKIVKEKSIRLANGQEYSEITGVPSGAARVYNPGLPTYIDNQILDKEYLTGGTGSFTVSFRYKTEDLNKIPGVKWVDISSRAESGIRRIFAGMRPTGRLHIGNYLGSAKGMLALQDNPEFETIYMVVDLHGITTPYNKDEYQANIKNVLTDYLAVGLDPEKSILSVQSLIPEHLELAYLFSAITTIAKLSHLPTFKEKVKQYPEHSTMALLNYPVLMAADILLYHGELVPVGVDQESHIEVAREIARRMNQDFGTNFPEPQRFTTKGESVPSLTGEGKMSKTVEGSYIALTDSAEEIKAKLARVPTDKGGPGEAAEAGRGVKVLFKLAELFIPNRLEYYAEAYRQGKLRYGEMKPDLAKAIHEELRPIQERRRQIVQTPGMVEEIIRNGAEKARKIAAVNLAEVKEKMGLKVEL